MIECEIPNTNIGTGSQKKRILRFYFARICKWLLVIFGKRRPSSYVHVTDLESQHAKELTEFISNKALEDNVASIDIMGPLLLELRLFMEKSFSAQANNNPFKSVAFEKEAYDNALYKLALINTLKRSIIQHYNTSYSHEIPDDQLAAFDRIVKGFGIQEDALVVKAPYPYVLRSIYAVLAILVFISICAFI